MSEAMVYLAAAGFALALFPVHISNYIFIDTEKKFAGLNIGAYRYFNFYNANTVENKPGEMQVNGKSMKIDLKDIHYSAYKIFNSLCIYKVVQLCDFGVNNEQNAYIALAQNALTTAIYKFMLINGNHAKLRNYTIINQSHGFIRYYCKSVTVINGIVVAKIMMILIMEKLYAHKKF